MMAMVQFRRAKKENVYFVLNNESNSSKKAKNKRSSFGDDCGVLDSSQGTSPRSNYIRDSGGYFTT